MFLTKIPLKDIMFYEVSMSLIGVINSSKAINERINRKFTEKISKRYKLRFFSNIDKILEFLSFDLPEVIILNFSDPSIDISEIEKKIKKESWLHNFGIIGLYDNSEIEEEELLSKVKNINVLALLAFSRIQSHIVKCVRIIEHNRQIIFSKDLSGKLVDKATGSFRIENDPLSVSVYASLASTVLSQQGCITPENKMRLQLSLSELIINGVEHGNCGISYEEKTEFLKRGLSAVELVAEKCQDPKIAAKRVTLDWEIFSDKTKFVIRDEGDGFDNKKITTQISNNAVSALHGRGITMAAHFAESLGYNNKGNEATLIIKHDVSVYKRTPEGFLDEESIFTKKDDIVFYEGEPSNFLYYISSGKFSVFHKSRHVGMLGPDDIFMGEMSFLLGNRRSATVRAETEGKLVKITKKTFLSTMKEYPHYGLFLSRLIARKLVRANARSAFVQTGEHEKRRKDSG